MAKLVEDQRGCIYFLLCLANNKGYVGQHCTLKVHHRLAHHKRLAKNGHRAPLYYAMRKYGFENFEMRVVWRGPVEKLDAAERRWIKKLNTFIDDGCGYNCTRGGQNGARGVAAVVGKQLSALGVEVWKREGHREMMVAKRLASWRDKETRQRYIDVRQATKDNPATAAKRSKSMLKLWNNVTPEYRKRHGKAISKGNATAEATANHRAAGLRLWQSEEYQATISAARRATWQDEDYRKRVLAAIKRGKARAKRARERAAKEHGAS
jgi:group I intron endonuclease